MGVGSFRVLEVFMAIIQFTSNYQDLSTDKGYQFKFFCDKCGNGYLTSFQTSITGMAGGLLRAAGSIFGGIFSQAGHGAYEIQRAIGGKAHDDAFATAVEECKQHFKQCTRCGKWVCPEVCFNHKAGLCEGCAPDFEQEKAAAQAHAAKEQLYEKARTTDYVSQVDMKGQSNASCPSCGAVATGSKFCPECGHTMAIKKTCSRCEFVIEGSPKFCPECGNKIP